MVFLFVGSDDLVWLRLTKNNILKDKARVSFPMFEISILPKWTVFPICVNIERDHGVHSIHCESTDATVMYRGIDPFGCPLGSISAALRGSPNSGW